MSDRKLFGTDGIRGRANIYPMTCEVAMSLGRAVTHYFQTKLKESQPSIILGKDTRRSCYMLEQAFSAGVCSQGGKVILTGPLPTPGVAFVTKSMRADVGVVISASHNSYLDNGIKLFDGSGHKLSDEIELELEKMIEDQSLIPVESAETLGKAKRLDEAFGRYIVAVKSVLPDELDLDDMRIVLDCANGAAYKVAPLVFSELGAEVFPFGISPNGININDACGSLYPENCIEGLKSHRADIGICLDGDADRLIVVDEEGDIVDGDVIIGICTKLELHKNRISKDSTIVGTVMSNLGLENYVTKKLGLKFHRTKVGDRYIVEYMRENEAYLGGEPSGHIIFKNYSTTGDGILAALKVIEAMKTFSQKLSELKKEFELYPSILTNVEVTNKVPLSDCKIINQAIESAEKELNGLGRVLLRYSGTENLLRVMVEGEDINLVNSIEAKLVLAVNEELGKK